MRKRPGLQPLAKAGREIPQRETGVVRRNTLRTQIQLAEGTEGELAGKQRVGEVGHGAAAKRGPLSRELAAYFDFVNPGRCVAESSPKRSRTAATSATVGTLCPVPSFCTLAAPAAFAKAPSAGKGRWLR